MLSIKLVARLMACWVLASLFSLRAAAQQTTPPSGSDPTGQTQAQSPAPEQKTPPAQPVPSDKTPDKSKDDQSTGNNGKVAGTSNSRLVFLPNFLTVTGGHLPPLTAKQKFKVVALGAFDPVQLPWWGLLSGINQATNAEPAYGQGWVGYAKRYGTTAADSTIENFMVGAVFPSILHQDPRFYQSSDGGFAHRTGYAVSRIFVTRGDSGHTQFNASEIVGSAFAACVSTFSYHPRSTFVSTPTNPHMFIPSDRTLVNTASVWGTQIAYDTITTVLKEFWPDIARKMKHKHKGEVVAPVTPNP